MIYKLFENLKKDFKIKAVVEQKPTARCPYQYICDVDNQEILVVIAKTKIQKFYLDRAIEKQKEFFDDFSSYFKFNLPTQEGTCADFKYVIYPYLKNLSDEKKQKMVAILNEIYETQAKIYDLNEDLINKIKEDFLSAFPPEFEDEITNLDEFKNYFNELKSLDKVSIYKEHGDYTSNNLLSGYLLDFEFARSFQPIGFDIYDYYTSINSAKRKKVIHKELHSLKYSLIDKINEIIDRSTEPKIEQIIEYKSEYINKVEPNFAYNRFDFRFGENYDIWEIIENKKIIYVPLHIENDLAIIGVWLVDISQCAFNNFIKIISEKYPHITQIYVRYSLNTYRGLDISNHWIVELSDTILGFDEKLSAKTRYNTKWYPKKIREDLGEYEIKKYSFKNISNDIVEKYFEFKLKSHNIDYQMSPLEYLKTFYVTHAYVLKIKNETQAILFDSNFNEISYLENFGFNNELSKYSLGMVLYYYYITDLIKNEVKYIYLGDGSQEYKKRFNGKNKLAFDGFIQIKQNKYSQKKSVKSFTKKFKSLFRYK